MLSLENLTKTFRKNFWSTPFDATSELSFSLDKGEVIGFLGANGAGKTTTMKMIMGFISPTSGSITWDHSFGKSRQEIFQKVGFMPERPYFYPHLKGYEFLNYMGLLCDMSPGKIKERTIEWGEKLNISFALDRRIKDYSKGMLQRIGFLATLLHDPELIILDEPLSGLDPVGRKEFKDAILQLAKEGKTIFFSSHIVSDVEEICERVIFIEKGKKVFDGSIDKVISENSTTNYRVRLGGEVDLSTFPDCEVVKQTQDFITLLVKENAKDSLLKQAMTSNISVEMVARDKPTLENVFYKVKSHAD